MAEMWYYTSEGKQMDPVTLKELKRMAGDGTLKPTDMVWKDGMARWIRAGSVTELFPDPASALDPYFTHTRQEKKQDPNKTGVTPAAGTSSTSTTTPKRKASDDDEDEGGPPRRRAESAAAGGSSIGMFLAMGCAVIVLVGGFLAGVVLLVVVLRPAADETKKDGDQGRKDGEVATPIDADIEYDATIKPGHPHVSKLFTFKADTSYQVLIKPKKKDDNARFKLVFKDAGGNDAGVQLVNLIRPGVNTSWPQKNAGDFRIALELAEGNKTVNATVTLREKAGGPKNDPLPPDTLEGNGRWDSDPIGPRQIVEKKFRIKADHNVSFNATFVQAGKGTKFDVVVVRDADRNAEVGSDRQKPKNASVRFRRDVAEIVVVRIINAGSTTNKVIVNYDVSP
ncbi:MAG: DUF4339 domain-containing protein [Planctomycetes bacterium]|nr:DUF4339 domain-containing protein [Planctomycetota bacterium]